MEANHLLWPTHLAKGIAQRSPLRTAAGRVWSAMHDWRAVLGTGAPHPEAPPAEQPQLPAQLLEATVSTVDFLAHVDRDLHFAYISDASLSFIGYSRAYLQTISLADLVAANDAAKLGELFERATGSGQTETGILHLVKSLTYPTCVELRVRAAPYQGVAGFAVSAFDVSAWRANEERLTYALHHDELTGLENLAAAEQAIAAAQQAAESNGTRMALLVLDLDNYERVNRSLGYAAGDQMLRETAQRLQAGMRRSDRLARCSNDKFAVLMHDVRGDDEIKAFAKRLLATVLQPYSHNGHAVHMSASIGIAPFPNAGHQPGYLLHKANLALVQAKQGGGNTLKFYEPETDIEDLADIQLETDLYDGVRNGEFSLHFQPIMESSSGGVAGVEALMRWQHPKHGLVPPSVFIPLAETLGLITFLGNWALKAACMQLQQWDAAGIDLEYMSVNVSTQQFRDRHFVASVREALELTGVAPHRVVLEITESVLMHDPEQTKTLLQELTALGIRFAVDDFGTGYSSLAYLQRFPLAKLKIDRSFIENLLTSRNDRAIVSAVVKLAQTLNLQLVAEGVETEAQHALLTEMGCRYIQGWLVCEALPTQDLAQKFAARELHACQYLASVEQESA